MGVGMLSSVIALLICIVFQDYSTLIMLVVSAFLEISGCTEYFFGNTSVEQVRHIGANTVATVPHIVNIAVLTAAVLVKDMSRLRSGLCGGQVMSQKRHFP